MQSGTAKNGIAVNNFIILPYYKVRSILHLHNTGLITECIHPPVCLCVY
jgi:hypothetical protein